VTSKNGGDPTSRRRRTPDQMLRDSQEIIRRYQAGEKDRGIARAMGLHRETVRRVIGEYKAAQETQRVGRPEGGGLAAEDLDDLDTEAAALLAKYEGGFDAEAFDIADADPELVARFEGLGIDLTDPDAVAVLAALTRSPTDPLNTWRIRHLPKTAEWQAGHDKLGRPLAEAAVVNAKVAAGWRYHDFAWHPPACGD
jgi:hypothetical protein